MYQVITIDNETYAVQNTRTGRILALAYVNVLDAIAACRAANRAVRS